MIFLKLAWRNIWRNRVRTLITMAAVFVAVILSTLLMSLKEGTYEKMTDSMVGAYTGYAQVHAAGYWDDRTLDNSMVINDTLQDALSSTPGITSYLPRIEGFVLAASEEMTKASSVVGVDPELESKNRQLHERVVEGSYLEANDRAVLIGSGLAKYLRLGIGDTLVLLGQGYRGANAVGKYPIKGIVKFGSPELSKMLVFLPVKEAAYLFDLEEKYTSLILQFEDNDMHQSIVAQLSAKVGSSYEAITWEELSPELTNMIATDRMEGYVFMFILYMVISFGIFGTVLMMLSERKHEFGVLVAVGMKRLRLASMVWLEVINISILGAITGTLAAFPITAYFYINPIELGEEDMKEMIEDYGMEPVIQASIDPGIFIQQGVIVFLIASAISIYPFLSLLRLNAVKAMRS